VNGARRSRSVGAVLLDIEGTTTPIAFVYETLFPYARANLTRYLDEEASRPDVAGVLERLDHERAQDPEAPRVGSVVDYLQCLMDRDRKSTPLKELQGLIWEEGYTRGDLTGDLFPDVPRALERWHLQRLPVGIFSSGSVLAQRLLFSHSTAGDLTGWIRWHFDTSIGSKGDPASYRRIAETMNVQPGAVLFISDVVRELDAARAADMQTRLSLRPGNAPQPDGHSHEALRDFDALAPEGRD
jgi:enolase-phosphatase E1